MPVKIDTPSREPILEVQELNQALFSKFGEVIENPAPSVVPSPTCHVPANAVKANQGSALKYLDVTHMKDLYSTAPSRQTAKAVMNMFVCAPRELLLSERLHVDGLFAIELMERHPFTSQTFIPLGLSRGAATESRYLVIVAPSLSPSQKDEGLPVPSVAPGKELLPGRGLPDLINIKAFVASGSQAVTYGAGTWHAPMVAIGKKPINFVVVQFANGVDLEDCQEAEIEKGRDGHLMVAVPEVVPSRGLWKL